MDDTQRLDALEEYGLCLTGNFERIDGVWHMTWRVVFDIDKNLEGESIRDVIDRAVAQIKENGRAA